MKNATFVYGLLLTGLGLIGYFATGQASKTALIPCIFGLPIVALAVANWLKSGIARQTGIAAGIISLLAFAGTVRGLIGVIALLTGGDVARPSAVIIQAIMAIASLIYLVQFGIWLWRRNSRISNE